MDLYMLACEHLRRVAAAWPGRRQLQSSITPCARGYCAQIGTLNEVAQTPREAAMALCRRLAADVHYLANLLPPECETYVPAIDALSEAYEALGGDWRAV